MKPIKWDSCQEWESYQEFYNAYFEDYGDADFMGEFEFYDADDADADADADYDADDDDDDADADEAIAQQNASIAYLHRYYFNK